MKGLIRLGIAIIITCSCQARVIEAPPVQEYWICTGPVASLTNEQCRISCGFGCFSENDYDDSICRSCGLRFNNTPAGSLEEMQFRRDCPIAFLQDECKKEAKGQPTRKPTVLTTTQPTKSTTMPTTPQSRTAMLTTEQRTRADNKYTVMIGVLIAAAVITVALTLLIGAHRCWPGNLCRKPPSKPMQPEGSENQCTDDINVSVSSSTDQERDENPFEEALLETVL